MGFFSFAFLLSSLRFFLPVFVLAIAPVARAQLVINEIYYDHPGSDDGYEFIELFNVSPDSVSVADCTIEFHNGSGEGFAGIWNGDGAARIAPGGLYTVGGAGVVPAPDAALGTSLQNGPDALRVVVAGRVSDTVGYGGLDDPLYSESTGAACVTAGFSIGRMPDGEDTGNNAVDFAALTPSPGAWNLAQVDLALRRAARTQRVHVHRAPTRERFTLRIENHGLGPVAAGAVRVTLHDSTVAAGSDPVTASNAGVLSPGGSEEADVFVLLERGYHRLLATLDYPGDERANNNSLVLLRRVGEIDLVVSEVLSAPPPFVPQFVEFYNGGAEAIDIAGYTMRDRAHSPALMRGATKSVRPGHYVVCTPDTLALVAAFGPLPPGALFAFEGPWPTINRTGTDGADSLVILDTQGLRVEAVAIPSIPSGNTGRSLERVDLFRSAGGAVWVLSSAVSGATPGRADARALSQEPGGRALDVAPNPFAPGRGEILIVTIAPLRRTSRAVVTVFDTGGREIAVLGSATVFPAVLAWDGVDRSGRAPLPGLYIIAAQFYGPDGARAGVERVVVGCAATVQ